MKDKDLLLKLIDDNYRELKNTELYDEYVSYLKLISKFKKMVSDLSVIDTLDDNDSKVLNMVIDNGSKLIKRLKNIYSSKYRDSLSQDDIQNMVDKVSNDINNVLLSSERFIKLHNMMNYYPMMRDIIIKDEISDNYMHVIDFIVEDCYKKGKISAQEAVSLNLAVANYATIDVKKENEEDDGTEELIIEENEESIYDKLVEIFNKYGYDFDKLKKDVKDNFNKYIKDLDYVDYVLSKFQQYGIEPLEIEICQKAIYKILISNDKETFDDVCSFVDDNDCSLFIILDNFAGAFNKKDRKYRYKKRTDNGVNKGNNGGEGTDFVDLSGSYYDFIKNVEMLKNVQGLDSLTDAHFNKFIKFINTPNNKILENLEILRQYGIIGKDEFPSSSVSLIGNYTSYQLDQFIETGHYDYIKQNLGKLCATKNPTKFYKLRRAWDLGEVITRGRGYKSEIMQDSLPYKGIHLVKDGEETRVFQSRYIKNEFDDTEELLVDNIPEGKRKPPRYHLRSKNLPLDAFKRELYNENYLYQCFEPTKIFSKGDRISRVFELEDNYLIGYEEEAKNDDFIKFLDNYRPWNSKAGKSVPVKKDDYTYEFRPADNPEQIIRISRQKVLRLCNLLKKYDMWINNEDFNKSEKVAVILSVLVKDSILSYWELSELRIIIKYIVNDYQNSNYNNNIKIRGVN
ncbi:MAG: hypothetical protein VZS44_04135 [Bacilli bacterium]|nr:hypothetical protein [Bacilli bacterium]